jgi:GDP-4-dehydro-6-deoxy-D-mannose reductase
MIGDVLDRLLALAAIPISIAVDESRLRPSDIPLLRGDSSRLRAALGWAPARDLDRTLQDTLEYYRAKPAARPA